jgi:hypothetical protein
MGKIETPRADDESASLLKRDESSDERSREKGLITTDDVSLVISDI